MSTNLAEPKRHLITEDALLRLLEAAQPVRALTDEESMLLEKIMRKRICKPRVKYHYTAEEDRRMLQMKRRGMQAPDIAAKLGKTAWSVRARLYKLRRREKDKAVSVNGKGYLQGHG